MATNGITAVTWPAFQVPYPSMDSQPDRLLCKRSSFGKMAREPVVPLLCMTD
jgi:hypothetical protein